MIHSANTASTYNSHMNYAAISPPIHPAGPPISLIPPNPTPSLFPSTRPVICPIKVTRRSQISLPKRDIRNPTPPKYNLKATKPTKINSHLYPKPSNPKPTRHNNPNHKNNPNYRKINNNNHR